MENVSSHKVLDTMWQDSLESLKTVGSGSDISICVGIKSVRFGGAFALRCVKGMQSKQTS